MREKLSVKHNSVGKINALQSNSLIVRTALVSQESGVMRPHSVGGMFRIALGCFGTPKGSCVFRQIKTAYLIEGRQMTQELN